MVATRCCTAVDSDSKRSGAISVYFGVCGFVCVYYARAEVKPNAATHIDRCVHQIVHTHRTPHIASKHHRIAAFECVCACVSNCACPTFTLHCVLLYSMNCGNARQSYRTTSAYSIRHSTFALLCQAGCHHNGCAQGLWRVVGLPAVCGTKSSTFRRNTPTAKKNPTCDIHSIECYSMVLLCSVMPARIQLS